jgi:hypothetical protein
MQTKFKKGDIIICVSNRGHQAYSIGDIGTVTKIELESDLIEPDQRTSYFVNFNIQYTGERAIDYVDNSTVVWDNEFKLADFCKSPLWKLMNGVEE